MSYNSETDASASDAEGGTSVGWIKFNGKKIRETASLEEKAYFWRKRALENKEMLEKAKQELKNTEAKHLDESTLVVSQTLKINQDLERENEMLKGIIKRFELVKVQPMVAGDEPGTPVQETKVQGKNPEVPVEYVELETDGEDEEEEIEAPVDPPKEVLEVAKKKKNQKKPGRPPAKK